VIENFRQEIFALQMFLIPPDRIKTELAALKVEAMEEEALLLISRACVATMAVQNVDTFFENQFEMGHTDSADANFYSDRLRDRALHATG
jgi:hypothetical protein